MSGPVNFGPFDANVSFDRSGAARRTNGTTPAIPAREVGKAAGAAAADAAKRAANLDSVRLTASTASKPVSFVNEAAALGAAAGNAAAGAVIGAALPGPIGALTAAKLGADAFKAIGDSINAARSGKSENAASTVMMKAAATIALGPAVGILIATDTLQAIADKIAEVRAEAK